MILFDLGGTLDGDGQHWLDRFFSLYDRAGLARIPKEKQKEAFYWADSCAEKDPEMPGLGLRPMLDKHVAWQLARLGVKDPGAQKLMAEGFAQPAAEALNRNRRVLSELAARGFVLGIISNFYGNVDTICREFGLIPYLSLILDSRKVGLSKPDPAIFNLALEKMKCPAGQAVYVGDSFDRDIRPAKSVGMKAVWVQGEADRPCPNPALPDFTIRSLSQLPTLFPQEAPVL